MKRKNARQKGILFDEGQLTELFLQDEEEKARYRRRERKRLLLIAAALLVLLAVVTIAAVRKAESIDARRYPRPDAEEGERTQELHYYLSREGERWEVRQRLQIAAREYTPEEAEEYLDLAQERIAQIAAGENPSLSEVSTSLTLPAYVDGLPVSVHWKTDRNWFRSDGTLREDIRVTERVQTTLQAELTCSEQTRIVQMPVTIVPVATSRDELIVAAAEEEAEEAEERQRQSDYFELPEQIGDYAVETEKTASPYRYLLLVIPAGACMILLGRTRLQRECRRRRELLAAEYPVFVDQLLLYVRAGLSVYSAWSEVCRGFEKTGRYPYLAAEMRAAEHEMDNGVATAEALENFGSRTGVLQYRRFAFLVAQNLTRGTRNLPELLEYEVKDAREKKKNDLQRKGEEAGTKLLLPMMVLLLIVLVLVLVPALLQL